MFGRIAAKYDLLNCLMTFGQDIHWRKEAIRRLEIRAHNWILDVGAGTGDIALEVLRENSDTHVVACDITNEMISIGKKRFDGNKIFWVIADAQFLPFAKGTFDRVISGFLLRNVADVNKTLSEQFRIISKGGKYTSLDTTKPSPGILYPFIVVYLRWVIPLLGKVIAGDSEAYRYLPESTENFLKAEDLAICIRSSGFVSVKYILRMFGTIAIHWGEKA
jgi:demethylmenaquinone methyltransferase/2-methoxy-6-polyprenyl-1,4-benzoquinol methylase